MRSRSAFGTSGAEFGGDTVSTAIVTDSTADLPAGLAAERAITVVPLTVMLEGKSYLDGVDITADDFYRRLAAAGSQATTSQPAPGRFAEAFQRLLEDHDEVVSLHISEKLSGTYAAAVQGTEMTGARARIRVVDSEMVSMPLGLMALAASQMAEAGAGGREVAERLGELRRRVNVFFVVATLEYLRRGGRIGAANALLGSVLQVKPVLTIQNGQVTPLERVRTQDRAIARLVELVSEQDRGRGLCAIVGHAAAGEVAERIAAEIEPRTDTLLVQPLGPVVGAHAGPGTVGVGCYPAELFPLGLKKVSAAAAS
jgi:DegV family protein with EDD domain